MDTFELKGVVARRRVVLAAGPCRARHRVAAGTDVAAPGGHQLRAIVEVSAALGTSGEGSLVGGRADGNADWLFDHSVGKRDAQ